ncbi:TonB-dependent receptor [Flavobacteriaceae bacterium F08102]|nr:TonB-dependent receptor [Flavobacteriaceae bacterium F08102]
MRLLIFLCCFSVFSMAPLNVLSQNVKIVIDADKVVTIDEIFNMISQQSDYKFIYQEDLFKKFPLLHLKKGTIKANKLLEESLSNSQVFFEFTNKNTIVIRENPPELSNSIEIKEVFQQLTIKGTVLDELGQPLPGVNVIVKGSKLGVSTDADGTYQLVLNGDRNTVLTFSYIGYVKQEITIGDNTTIDVQMKVNLLGLDEVIVVGYGTSKKRDLTGSIGSISSRDIQEVRAQTVDQTLVGKMAGVYVQSKGGAPGAGAFVYVRGLSQIRGDNQPLYVIDGVPVVTTPNTESYGLINAGKRENPLLAIHPNDIERVDVLKDASAAAIYGSRAANGVVIVTTKRGQRGQTPKFSFNTSTTIQNPVDTYDYLSTTEWKKWVTGIAQNILNDYPPEYWPVYFPNENAIVNDPDSYFGNEHTDWQELVTNENALWNQYNFKVSGGAENISYLVSSSISNQEGVLIENKFKRYSFHANLDVSVTKSAKIGAFINYNHSVNKIKGFQNFNIGSYRPDLPAYRDNGSYATFLNRGSEQFTALGDGMQTRNTAISKNLLGSIYGEIKIFDGLTFKSQLNIGTNTDRTDEFLSSQSTYVLSQSTSGLPGARLSVQTNDGWSTAFENTVSLNSVIKQNHHINGVLGVSWNRSSYNAERQKYRGFPDDEVLIDINSATFFDDAESEYLEQGLNSIFGRFNYNYKGKYLATFTARRDGSTKFGSDNRYGFFPSGALAWNVHNEDFFKSIKTVNQLKLRASIGKVGSDNLPSFTYLAYYNGDYATYDEQNGIAVTGVPNTNIKWEETNQLDLGLEFGLFNNRLRGEVIYYKKNTSGIILFTPITYETGSISWNNNIADVSNRGWEFLISGEVVKHGNFTWNSSFNLSTLTNNVDNLYVGNVGSQEGIVEGQPIGVITGYDVLKIAQTYDEIETLNLGAGGLYQSSLSKPGDYIFKDINEDGIVNSKDIKPLGDINPAIFGGWNNNIAFKNWDITMNWNFSQGAKRAYSEIVDLYFTNIYANVTSLVLDTWSSENRDARYAVPNSQTHGYIPTSRAIVDASYIKLRSASIGYRLPKTILDNIGISSAKLTLSGNNLFTISNYPGLDPEDVQNFSFAGRTSGYLSDDGRSYPNVRSFTLSLNINF